MAKRPTIILKKKQVPAPEPDDFEDETTEQDDDELGPDDDDLGDTEQFEDDVDNYEPPARSRAKAKPVQKKSISARSAKPAAKPAAKPTPKSAAKPTKAAPAKKSVKAPVAEPPPVKRTPKEVVHAEADEADTADVEKFGGKFAKKIEPVSIKKVEQTVVSGLLLGIMDAMAAHDALLLERLNENQWQIHTGPVVSTKLTNQEYEETVCTPEYLDWQKQWGSLTYEEKVAWAKKLKVRWEDSGAVRINTIRMAQGVKDKLGVKKYKPEYSSGASRHALQQK
jgi:hypothetical protein